jgi:hypothetical protein
MASALKILNLYNQMGQICCELSEMLARDNHSNVFPPVFISTCGQCYKQNCS